MSSTCEPAAEVTDVIPRVSEPGAVPVQVFDATGALLLVSEAVPTHQAGPVADGDVLQRIVRGRELPDSGPTALPTLAPGAVAPAEPEPVEIPPDAPSGSALSAVDMGTLFGVPAARSAAVNGG